MTLRPPEILTRRTLVWVIRSLVLTLPVLGRAQAPIAVAHVTVIDGTSPLPRRDQTVLIRGTRITEVAPSATTSIPTGSIVVDGHGKFLIPGLWDMHVHTVMPGGRRVLPLYLANGVTGVRDMAGDWDTLRTWRRNIAEGRLAGPRMIVSGPYIEGGDVPIPHILARTPDEARAAVDSLVAMGVDFIKLHSQFKRDVFFAAARRARERGIPFTGHVPRSITAAEASDSGQHSLEHLLQIPSVCTPAESLALAPRFQVQSVLARCSSADLAPLWARLVRNGTYVVPTLVAQYEVASWPNREVPGDAYARYLPDSLRRYVAGIFPMPDDVPPGADVTGRALFDKRVEIVGVMHRAGVTVMPGTDAPLRNSPPGFGLHQELALFAKAGISNFNILRAATIEPARYFGMLDSLGTIGPGQLADVVLLDANPLEDIANAQRVAAVVANGRLMSRDDRQALLRMLSQPQRPK